MSENSGSEKMERLAGFLDAWGVSASAPPDEAVPPEGLDAVRFMPELGRDVHVRLYPLFPSKDA